MRPEKNNISKTHKVAHSTHNFNRNSHSASRSVRVREVNELDAFAAIAR